MAFSGQLQVDVSDTDMGSRANINLTRHSPLHRSPAAPKPRFVSTSSERKKGQEIIQTWILRATFNLSRPHLFTDLDCTVAKADVDFKQEEEDCCGNLGGFCSLNVRGW